MEAAAGDGIVGTPLEHMEQGIVVVLVATAAACVLSYALLPHIYPTEPGKVPFRHFVLGTAGLRFVRGPNDPPITKDDFPDSGGTPEHNITKFADMLDRLWTPGCGSSLRARLLWYMLPWYLYCHIVLGLNRVLTTIGGTYMLSCVFAYINLSVDHPDNLMMSYKLQACGFVFAIAGEMCMGWCNLLLSTAGTDPICCGMQLQVLRKMHRLSCQGLVKTSSAETQQLVQEGFNLAVSLWISPLKTCGIELIVGLYAFYQIYTLYGLSCIILGAVTSGVLWALGAYCDSQRWDYDQKGFQSVLLRQGTLNMVLDNFRALRLCNSMALGATPLAKNRQEMRQQQFMSQFWGSLGGAFNSQIGGIMVLITFFLTAFSKDGKVSFEKSLLVQGYMATCGACMFLLLFLRTSWLDIYARADRLEQFLSLPEREDALVSEGPLQLQDASFAWPVPQPPAGEATEEAKGEAAGEAAGNASGLKDALFSGINVEPLEGGLTLVCGAVGSGKSSLLMALLGEMPRTEGKAWLPAGPVAYQPQVASLFEGTIRDNVLFGLAGSECNEAHLREALVAAQLAADMDDPRNTLHAKRDLTEVGKKGGHLSGGQRARTALARSIYAVRQGATLALLDDPVASVDNEVVQAAWDTAIVKAMKGTTRVVIVNSQLLERLAPTADRLLVLDSGRIVFHGTMAEATKKSELIASALGGTFDLAGNFPTEVKARPEAPSETPAGEIVQQPAAVEEVEVAELEDGEDPAMSLADMLRDCEGLRNFVSGPPPEAGEEACCPLKLEPEEWEKLRIRLLGLEKKYGDPEPAGKARLSVANVIVSFLRRGRGMGILVGAIGLLQTLQHPAIFATVRRWENGESGWSNSHYLALLTALYVGFALLGVVSGTLESIGRNALVTSLDVEVDQTLTTLSMAFFWRKGSDAEPLVRKVVNMDLGSLAGIVALPVAFLQVFVAASATAIHVPSLWVLVVIALLGYVKVTRISDWKNNQLGPAHNDAMNLVWTRVVEQFDNLVPFRALRRQRLFEKSMHAGMMIKPYHNYITYQLDVLLGVLNHSIGAVFNVFAVAIVFRMKRAGGTVTEAYTFFTLASTLAGMINGLCQLYMPFSMLLTQYRQLEDFLCTDLVEPQTGADAPANWPGEGQLEFEAVTFRYVPHAPAALRGVSMSLQPREKVGIVGKTGSGKSTLVSIVLRLGPLLGVPPSSGGRVLLDGVDVATLRVSDLRSHVAVVPQEPMILPVSLKENVGQDYTDAEVVTALEWCSLDARQVTQKATLAEALASPIVEGVLSVGQQQLLMAARALVRRPKVLVLDECTASLDRESADRLLEAVMTHGKDATLLSIAHRLRFVQQSDRVLILSHGEVVSFDTPAKLLEDPNSYFSVNLRLEQQEESSTAPAAS